jgi:hypothetical protein
MNTGKHKFYTTTLKAFPLYGILLFCFALLIVPALAQSQPKMSSRILLIPLDDRPPCLQFPVKMGLIGDAEIVTPPKELLGRFTEPGNSDQIIKWLKTQNLKTFDAAIVSVDMLAYGGLVAMRIHQTDNVTAMRRLEFLREMRGLAPKMKIYGSSVIMRLAPTGDVKNEAYREKLARWAEISVESDAKSKGDTAKLEKEIPAFALADYKAARVRDLKINLQTINFVREGTIDYLILSQDDAKPKGIHVADREKLIAETNRLKLSEKIAVQPGADEVSMLLLARSLTDKYNFHPRIKAIYSSEELANKAMPFEDRALRETVSFHIKATGSCEVQNEKDADLLFYVYPSRFEAGRAVSFVEEITVNIKKGKRIIVADIDPKGDVQGGDKVFTNELGKRGVLRELNGYASWNTAGNTIGTALPHGVVFALAQAKLMKSKDTANRVQAAQDWFVFHRVLDDFYYHTLVRAEAKNFIAQNKWNPFRLSDAETEKVEQFSQKLMLESFTELSNIYFGGDKNDLPKNSMCQEASNMTFDLPWNRTFEAEIDFQIICRN